MPVALVRPRRIEDVGDNKLPIWKGQELRRQDADDAIGFFVEPNRMPDSIRLPTEPPLPKPMREDDDFVLAGLVLAWRERAPEQRPRPENVETIGRHPHAIDALRLACAREIQGGEVERSETVECDALLFPIEEHPGRNRVPF